MAGGQILGREDRLAPSYCDLLPDDLRELSIRTFRKRDGRVPTLEEQEREYILWALEEAHGNQTLAAQMLDIDRVSLWRKLKRYGEERA